MNEDRPDHPNDADELYRRASALDTSRPSELVRHRVLKHAGQLAEDWRAHNSELGTPARAHRPWRQPAIVGTLAAAALAGLLITPRFLTTTAPPPIASSSARLSDRPSEPPGAPPMAAPAPRAAPAPMTAADAQPMTTLSPATDGLEPQSQSNIAAKQSPARSQYMAGARKGVTASDAGEAGTVANAAAPVSAERRASDPAAELRRAAEIGDIPKLQILFDQQPDLEARDAGGRTALMLAIQRGQSGAVDVLLAHGADPNAADGHGVTPLQAARAAHDPDIAAALRRAGAQ